MNRPPPAKKKTAPAEVRVLIVDDHPFLRLGLAGALEAEPGFSVCAAVASAEEALTAVENLRPDVVVTDLNLPGKSGLELIKDLATLRPSLPVIALSMHAEEIYAERCLRAGARGYVMKDDGSEKLVEAIRQVLAGGTHVSPKIAARIIGNFGRRRDPQKQSPIEQLTDREFEVFQHIGAGRSTQEVADRLHLSPKTVETHRKHIKAKLQIATVMELTSYAARWIERDGAPASGVS